MTQWPRVIFNRSVLAAFVLLMVVATVEAKAKSLSGQLTRIDPGMIEIRISKHENQLVVLNEDTTYERWTLYKRVPIDRRADFRSLTIGAHVRIEFRPDNPKVAQKVWIVIM